MNYLERVMEKTLTRFWINNPTSEEIEKAVASGARNVTTNPSYCSRLIKSEPDYIREVIDNIIINEKDNDTAADMIYQNLLIFAKLIMRVNF